MSFIKNIFPIHTKKILGFHKGEAKAMLLVVVANAITPLASFAFIYISSFYLSVEDFGLYSAAMAYVALLVGLTDLGLKDYLLSADGRKNLAIKPAEYAALIITLLGPLFFLSLWIIGSGSALLLKALFFEIIAFSIFSKALQLKYQFADRLSEFSSRDAMCKIISSSTKILVFCFTKSLLSAVVAAGLILFLAYGAWFIHEIGAPKMEKISAIVSDVFSGFKGWIFYTASFFSFFLYAGADRLIVAYSMSPKDLGIYSFAVGLLVAGNVIVSAVWSIYMPKVSKSVTAVNKDKLIILCWVLGAIIFFAYQILCGPVFGWIFPEKYSSSAVFLSALSVFFVFRVPNVGNEIYWVAAGQYKTFAVFRLMVGLLALVMSIALIEHIGLYAPVISLIASEAFLMLLLYIFKNKCEMNLT